MSVLERPHWVLLGCVTQGASRAAPGKSDLHAHGEGERVLALESREGTRASRRVEEGLSRSFSGGGGKPSPRAAFRSRISLPFLGKKKNGKRLKAKGPGRKSRVEGVGWGSKREGCLAVLTRENPACDGPQVLLLMFKTSEGSSSQRQLNIRTTWGGFKSPDAPAAPQTNKSGSLGAGPGCD